MPTGYKGEGKTYLKSIGKWVSTEKEKVFDYEKLNTKSGALLISFYRFYPDYYADLFRSPTARYKLELPQRLIMRSMARYRNVYDTGCRGLTKTYCVVLEKMISGELYPGTIVRYAAPNQKQAAVLATQAFHQIEKDYPFIASHWDLRNDRADMFRITTIYGSEFCMYAPRGDNCSETVAEEIGAEGENAFKMDVYENDILPTCRITRTVNQLPDRTHIDLQHAHISNACSRINRAYSVHRAKTLDAMLHGGKYEGIVLEMSWITALMGNIRDKAYIEDQRKTLSALDWKRELCAIYTGTSENPLIPDDVLSRSRKLMLMEDKHCGDREAIYIVSHDVSYVDSVKNAKCGDVVVKLTKYDSISKRDKFRKQVVYVDAYPPPATAFLQAQKLKKLWMKFCRDDAEATYLVVDAQAYGTEVVEELMKPTTDGTPNLCCYQHMRFAEIEQPNALPIIYPMKATSRGSNDADGDMIAYAQVEFEKGYVELLTSKTLDGVEAYKNLYDIKDVNLDGQIAAPYKQTDELVQEIQNLQTVVSGTTFKEKRKSSSIQRDRWSALKYALRMAQILENLLKKEKYRPKSSWSDAIDNIDEILTETTGIAGNGRKKLLSMRKR